MPVTLRDVARHLNLSHATVSMVLNDRRDVTIPESTRTRVLEAAKELGYQPNLSARALASGKTNMIALWSPSSHNSFYAEILFAIQRLAQGTGKDVLFREVTFGKEKVKDNLRSLMLPVDGILAIDSKYALDALGGQPKMDRKPIVNIGVYTSDQYDSVHVDLESGARDGLEHLWDSGFRDIGFLTVENSVDTDDPRARAYKSFCEERQISHNVIGLKSAVRDYVSSLAADLVKSQRLPRALFCYNDHVAMGVVKGVRDVGVKVPEQCAIVGCDGVAEAEYVDPPLTTIVQPVEEICRLGWEFLKERIVDPQMPVRKLVLKPTLVIRKSSRLR